MKKLLIIIDMQNDFITGSLGSLDAQRIVDGVCEKIINWDDDIILTKDIHCSQSYYLESFEGKKLPVPHCIQRTAGCELCDKVKAAIETVKNKKTSQTILEIEKATFGTFMLAERAKRMWPDEIEICGLCTDICVISNALILRAEIPDIPIKVHESLCAGVTREKHDAAIEVMKSCQIDVL